MYRTRRPARGLSYGCVGVIVLIALLPTTYLAVKHYGTRIVLTKQVDDGSWNVDFVPQEEFDETIREKKREQKAMLLLDKARRLQVADPEQSEAIVRHIEREYPDTRAGWHATTIIKRYYEGDPDQSQ